MTVNKNKYEPIWHEQLPAILNAIRNRKMGSQTISMPARQFEAVGNRKKYSFRLDLEDVEVTNNIGGSAVARDLRNVLFENQEALELLKCIVVTIKMDRNFTLTLE